VIFIVTNIISFVQIYIFRHYDYRQLIETVWFITETLMLRTDQLSNSIKHFFFIFGAAAEKSDFPK